MKVLITGATGLIGRSIIKNCHENNIKVHFLTTSKNKLNSITNCNGFYWNPSENVIDIASLVGVDTIVNLAGASISKPWTSSYKVEILNSRLQTLRLLKNTLKENNNEVTQIVSASAIGIYPDSLTNYYDEDFSEISTSFLGNIVKQWEAELDTFKDLGILIAKVRIGLVLSKDGGALSEIIKPIKFGLGAPFGSGKQWQSWIHVDDLSKLFLYTIQHKLNGIYNGVAPNAVSNQELTKSIAKQLKRPLFLPNIPKTIMKLILGEMHILLFESQRVSSKKIENLGFNFLYPNLDAALIALL